MDGLRSLRAIKSAQQGCAVCIEILQCLITAEKRGQGNPVGQFSRGLQLIRLARPTFYLEKILANVRRANPYRKGELFVTTYIRRRSEWSSVAFEVRRNSGYVLCRVEGD